MSHDKQKVLVTGASTGIGRAIALHLDSLGYGVYAGVRREEDARSLEQASTPRLRTVFLDVTDSYSIGNVLKEIRGAGDEGLYGLINNAGLSMNGPLEIASMPGIKKLFDVNVIGLLEVTKTFIPLLRLSRGRLVNVSSGHGLLAVPDKCVYAASKFAVEAISDSLRLELSPFGIDVSALVVGKVNTEVLGKIESDREAMISEADPDVVSLYSRQLEFFDKEIRDLPGISTDEVARTVARIMSAKRPSSRYYTGPGARKMKNLAGVPSRLRDMMLSRAIFGSRNA